MYRRFLIVFIFLFASTDLFAEQFVGQYTTIQDGEKIQLSLVHTKGTTYHGNLNFDGERLSFRARKHGSRLIGRIFEDGEPYPFVAFYKNNLLNFDFDGQRIRFNLGQ